MRHDIFLEQYKILESLLNAKMDQTRKRHFNSPVMEYINSPEGKLYREELNLIREIRNLLAHSPDIAEQAVIEPSEAILEQLKQIIEYVQQPPLALSYAVPSDSIVRIHLRDRALRTMEKMQKSGFSHLPVIENGVFYGVFSVGTVFSYALHHQPVQIDQQTRIEAFQDFIPIEQHITEKFLFLPKNASYFDARAEFERPTKRERRLAAIFITENGNPRERLLGMITPWDVLDDEEFQKSKQIKPKRN